MKLRDIATSTAADRSELEKRHEQVTNENQRLQGENDRLQVDINRSRTDIAQLHEQVSLNVDVRVQNLSLLIQLDAAMGSTRMVEHLTERNIYLEDQAR